MNELEFEIIEPEKPKPERQYVYDWDTEPEEKDACSVCGGIPDFIFQGKGWCDKHSPLPKASDRLEEPYECTCGLHSERSRRTSKKIEVVAEFVL